jgi:Skp family chaperone for outer membrane proteins
MKSEWLLSVLLAAGCAGIAGAAEQRFAVVDMEVVMKAHPETKSSQLILDQQVEEFESEQRELMKEREEAEEAFKEAREKSRNQALSEEAREKHHLVAEEKLRRLRELELTLRKTVVRRKDELRDQQLRMRRRIVKKLREMIAAYCKQKDITLVLDSALPGMPAAESVVYSAPDLDITEDILALIRKQKGGEPKGD